MTVDEACGEEVDPTRRYMLIRLRELRRSQSDRRNALYSVGEEIRRLQDRLEYAQQDIDAMEVEANLIEAWLSATPQ